ncbi:MAG: RelA/SpoT family protein [Candidatus Jorgensenbacteria bacterium]|nr:RelA/SpoT family protein [Candidatus Jorgensenbacteria bacterium]
MASLLAKYPKESLVGRAYAFAEDAHKDARRVSGDPYFTHSAAVAETVAGWGLDEPSIAAALLHDVAEDTHYTLEDLERTFGSEVRFLVQGLTKLNTLPHKVRDVKVDPSRQGVAEAENLRKFIVSFAEDLRVLLVKLSDRLHNMRTLAPLPQERQKKIAWETLELYAPLAYRLGMQKLSGELEDLAFPYALPDEHTWLEGIIKDPYEERLAYAKMLIPKVGALLKAHGIVPVQVDGRAKRHYSLYKKLLRRDMDITKIHDLIAVRVITRTVEDCYAALGIIHQEWPPFPGQFDDYIAQPKPNGYRSLHTTVFCVDHKTTEFQVRTAEMHEENELGIAAHWAYQQVRNTAKKVVGWSGVQNRKELRWVEQLRNWHGTFAGQEEFLQALKADFFKDRIFVLTPENDVVDLPAGATPVDFAYRIHSDVGDTCVGAKVNGKMTPVDTELRSGDVVEIITQKGKKPSEDWVRFVKTAQAKQKIRAASRASDRRLRGRTEGPVTELRIVNEDRPGYLKEVTAIFGNMKVNITHLASDTDHRRTFASVVVECPSLTKETLEKLLVKLKALPGTREVRFTYRNTATTPPRGGVRAHRGTPRRSKK